MATAYSSEVSVGTYNRLRLRVEYSGTSATCYMEFRRTSSYTGSWADSQATITFNGTTKSAPYSYSGTVGTSWVQLCNASGFSVSTSGGTYNWTFNNPGGSSVLGCSGSITIDAQGTAPTGLSLSNITPGTNQIAATVSVTGWGGLGDANTRFREMSVWEYNNVGGSNRRIQKATGNTLSSTITVTNSSEVTGSLTITPNTRYTLTTFASNGTMYTDQTNVTNTATLATAPTVSVNDYTDTTIVISYSTAADGGAYSKNIQYSLDGSTWTTGATVSSASATSGTYTISGLTAGTTYSIRTRVSTTAGTTTGSTLSQKTAQAPTKPTVSGTSGVTSNTISYGTTSFGYPASGTVYLYGGTSSSPTTQLTSKTSTGTSSYTHSSLTANKRYYYRARAYNGKVYSDYSTEVSVYTKAAAPTISVSGVTAKTVTIAYSTSADGGAYYKYIDYSLDGTNWTQGAAITTSSATSGTFTITGLAPDTSYTIRTKIRTTAAGDTSGPTVTASTKPALYGSVSGQAKLVEKFYGSANALGNPPLKGNTTQQTYTGKNKVGFSDGSGTVGNFTWSIQDGVITLNGTGSGSGTLKVTDTTLFKLVAGTRRLTIVPVSGAWTTGTMGIRPVTSGGTQRGYQQWYAGSPQSNATYTYTETQAEEAAAVDIYVGANAVFNNYKFYIMWTEGSTDDFDYEPYVGGTASPNPDYPQVVNVATGEQFVIVSGKNLSPALNEYTWGTNRASNLSATGSSISFKTSTEYSNSGVYITRTQFPYKCPALGQTGYVVSCTVNVDIASNISMGYEGSTSGTRVDMDIPAGSTRISFVTKEATNNIRFYVMNKTGATVTITNFQVETGSTATEFSDYAALCPINLGKNLFNPAQTPTFLNMATVSQITNGIRVTSTRTSTSSTSNFDSALYAVVRADDYIGKPLTVSVETMSSSTSGNQRVNIGVCNADASIREAKASFTTSGGRATYTPTEADRGKYIFAGFYAVNGVVSPAGSYVDYKNIQFEVNTASTTYAAYLEPIELRKINDHQDYIYKSDGDWYVHREIGKVVLDGSESWTFQSTSVYKYRLSISDAAIPGSQSVVSPLLSDHYVPVAWSDSNRPDYCISSAGNDTSQIAIRHVSIASLADYKTWLGSHNITVFYPLATPTNTKITNSILISQLNALWGATTYGDDTVLTIGAVDLQAIGTDIFQSTRRIEKFYGSVNGTTKLIYEE